MLKFIDLLVLRGIRLDDYKIHLATQAKVGDSPLNIYLAGNFKQWQEEQTRRNFPCKHILSLIDLPSNRWLFAGVYEVEGFTEVQAKGYKYLYQTKKLDGIDDLVGRVIVTFDRSRASYINGKEYGDQLIVVEILLKPMTFDVFPGYNKVILTHSQLKMVVEQQEPSWKVALSSVRGVYLITDTNTGKLYVGKASGTEGIWQRWCAYASNGHGGNEELKKIITRNGIDYADHFQYSILEFMDFHSPDQHILERESHWKKVFLTGKYGYN